MIYKFREKAINRDPNFNYRSNYKNGDWVYGNLISDESKYGFNVAKMEDENGVSGIEVDSKTLGIFTNCLDKNGKEICTGDKLKFKVYEYNLIERCYDLDNVSEYTGEVCFDDDFYSFMVRVDLGMSEKDTVIFLDNAKDKEIIGNKFNQE